MVSFLPPKLRLDKKLTDNYRYHYPGEPASLRFDLSLDHSLSNFSLVNGAMRSGKRLTPIGASSIAAQPLPLAPCPQFLPPDYDLAEAAWALERI